MTRNGAAAFLAAFLLAASAAADPAEVENIPSQRYFETALAEIQKAESSIRLYLYLISPPQKRLGSRVHRLVDALAQAAQRGVGVQVVLDRNIDWNEEGAFGFQNPSRGNEEAYQHLRARGVKVLFDDPAILLHAKVLVIDEKTVILGSTNWSEASLTRNLEANALVRSREFAVEILKGLRRIKLHDPVQKENPAVAVPRAFLQSPELLGRMVTARDEGPFDLYLYLLKTFGAGEEGKKIALEYELLKGQLGRPAQSEGRKRRFIQRSLRRLRDRYRLIDFADKRRQDPVVSLRRIGGPETAPVDLREGFVHIPLAYWDWGWDKRLTFPGRVMALLGELYSSLSPMAPVWFRSNKDLAQMHGISEQFVQHGLMDLRRRNLIEVKPDKLSPGSYGSRKANEYAPNPLYDPQELARAFRNLEQKHGEKRVRKAAGYASLVYEDSDVEGVERLILLEEEFGPEIVRRAVQRTAALHGSNPKKTMGYLINTIRRMGAQQRARPQS